MEAKSEKSWTVVLILLLAAIIAMGYYLADRDSAAPVTVPNSYR